MELNINLHPIYREKIERLTSRKNTGLHAKIDQALERAEQKTQTWALREITKDLNANTKIIRGHLIRRIRKLRNGVREGFKKGVWAGTMQVGTERTKEGRKMIRSGRVNQTEYPGGFIGKDTNGKKRIFMRATKDRLPIIKVTTDVEAEIIDRMMRLEKRIELEFTNRVSIEVAQVLAKFKL